MKNFVRFAVAGALLAGYHTAQAQAQPSNDASDLWLFVSNQAAGTTFAEDTGLTVASLLPTGSLVTGAVLNTSISDSFTVAETTALAAYIAAANSAGQTLQWGIEGVNYNGVPTAKAAGKVIGLTDNPVSQEANTSNMVMTPNLSTWANGFQEDVAYLAPTYTTGGLSYAFSAGSSAGNVWGANSGNNAGSTNLYGQGPSQAGIGLGQSAVFYGETGNGSSTGQVQSYILSSDLELTTAGVLETVQTQTTVPLPAALWLFGSGLLGLAGVGRRRSASPGLMAST
jgi:hypothetical protein